MPITPSPADLPSWDDMSDLDRGAALLHLHKREWEGDEYAVDEYPCRYLDDPRLVALNPLDACRHALTLDDEAGALPNNEFDRLYNLARDHEPTPG